MILPSQRVIDATIDAALMTHYDPSLSTSDVLASAARQNGADVSQAQEWATIKASTLNWRLNRDAPAHQSTSTSPD